MNNIDADIEIFADDIAIGYNEENQSFQFVRPDTGELIELPKGQMEAGTKVLVLYKHAKSEAENRKAIADAKISQIKAWAEAPVKQMEFLKMQITPLVQQHGKLSLPEGTIYEQKGRKRMVEVDPDHCKEGYKKAKEKPKKE